MAQTRATQNGLKLEKTVAETTSKLEETSTAQKIEHLKYEGIISSQSDEIKKLNAINQKLMETNQTLRATNQKLLSEAQRPPAPTKSRLGPPIPKRPVETLVSQRTKNDLWAKRLEYLDLEVKNQSVRTR